MLNGLPTGKHDGKHGRYLKPPATFSRIARCGSHHVLDRFRSRRVCGRSCDLCTIVLPMNRKQRSRWDKERKSRMLQKRKEGEGGPTWKLPALWKERGIRLRKSLAGVQLRVP